MSSENQKIITASRNQRTIAKEVSLSGIGLHGGEEVSMRFCPADPGTGVVFQRTDLPSKPIIPATVEYVTDTSRNTTIGIGDVVIYTIEHVLSAIRALDIDNIRVEVSAQEPPIMDGSAAPFVDMIEQGGVLEQDQKLNILKIQESIHYSEGDVHLVVLPDDHFRISYTLHYPNCKVMGVQYHSTVVNSDIYKTQIAPCRTFSKYEEISFLMDRGLIKGGSLSNAVVIKDDVVLSKGGLHFPDEMVRHKVLDLIGDISLVGFHFTGHIIAIRSGHAANCAFAKKIYDHIATIKEES